MSLDTPKIHKYAARIPTAEYTLAWAKCRELGISMNAGLIAALRHWCDSVEGNAPIPVHQKLSEVIRADLEAMEGRLLEALKPPVCTVKCEIEPTEGYSAGRLRDLLDTQRLRAMRLHDGGFVRDSLLSQGEAPAIIDTERVLPTDDPRVKQIVQHIKKSPGVSLSRGVTEVPAREGASFVQPENHLTVPGSLEWDKPAPEQRLWPESPRVNSLAPHPLQGQVWVITGDFDAMTTSRAREILQQAGAVVATTVNKKTSAVLYARKGEKEVLSAAQTLMLPIWDELQFLHMAKFIGADVRIPE